MSKISTYANATPVAADYALGDQASGPTTKTFLMSAIRDLMLASWGGKTTAISGATTATLNTLNVCSGSTAYTVTLPAVSGNAGQTIGFLITNTAELVTIDGNASETIDGSLTRIMWQYETAILYCDGSAWFKIGGKSIPMGTVIKQSAALANQATVTFIYPTYNTQVSGPAFMYASSLGKIPRPSNYIVIAGAVGYVGTTPPAGSLGGGVAINGATTVNGAGSAYLPSVNYQNVVGEISKALALNDTVGGAFYCGGSGTFSLLGGDTFNVEILEVPAW